MKIIHLVLGKANPLRMNGVNKLVHEMATTQKELGLDVTLWGITSNQKHDYPNRNFTTILFPSIFNKTRIDSTIKDAIDNLDKDVLIHIHGSFIPEFYLISRLLVERGISYVYTPHGALAPAALKRRNWKKKWYFEFFEKKLIEDAKAFIATGKSVYKNVDNLAMIQQKILIPNGQPNLDFQTNKLKRDQKLIFSFCGRIAIEHKGLDLLLNGFRIFLDQGGKAELQIIGDGSEMSSLKKIASDLNLLDHLKFHGAKYGNEKFKLLSQTNVFVHTSRMEGFPASVLEASALGLPCLISEDTNFGEYVEEFDCGLVIKNNTSPFIAKEMLKAQELLKNGKLEIMGANAKVMVESEFDWKKICLDLLTIYENKSEISIKNETVKAI